MQETVATQTTQHVCSCPSCDPSVKVEGPKQGPNHIAVRFWENDPESARARQNKAFILLNGEPVHAFEAILGDPGVVWYYPQPEGYSHICATCRDEAVKQGKLSKVGDSYIVLHKKEDDVVVRLTPEMHPCQKRATGRVEIQMEPATA